VTTESEPSPPADLFAPLPDSGPDKNQRLRAQGVGRVGLGPLDLEVAAAECVCLSGRSGAGKSLLLRTLADLDPHEGALYLDGAPRSEFTGPGWRRRVGLLPPDSAWWEDGVGAHFARSDADLFAALALEPEALAWRVDRLSSGERQRLALARLLCNRPAVLLLDEPTANLDPANVGRVEALITRYRELTGAAVVWVSHDPDQVARIAVRHLRMEGGRLAPANAP
jgi:ABC-type iron transport system FetAB ATPase subunit